MVQVYLWLVGWLPPVLRHVPPTCSLSLLHFLILLLRQLHISDIQCHCFYRQSQRQLNDSFFACFFSLLTINHQSMASFTVLPIPSLIFRTDCPHCHFTSDEIRSICSDSVVTIRYIYTGCPTNDFSVPTMPEDMRGAVISSEDRRRFDISPQC